MSKPAAVRHKRKQRMSQSPAVMAAVEARSLIKPVIVSGVTLAKAVTVIRPEDLGRLKIDESYQRLRITSEVNALIKVLRNGGQIADPVDVAERPDGSWYIVDGQQRFWAHWDCEAPMRANVHKVDSIESETNLFLSLNQRTRVLPRVIARGWPGPAGDFLRWASSSPKSPVNALVDMGSSSHLPLDATTIVKGALAVTTGLTPNGDMSTRILPRLDVALRQDGMRAWSEDFLKLVAAVFDMNTNAGRVRVLPVIALARVANRRFIEAGRPTFPRSCAMLRRVNWDTIVPTHAARFLGMVETEIERRWK